ncbi:alpha-1,3-mannosyl-glycoprotein 4-beta-N-acetylglucosaminyltransferase B-like [Saccostrea cucullata]|uniref:alpha-1,3-mannosyl-glycoprotein 4-beta-N-acetylglucosaminyltransferase B-like n=1 Tax=Saccostrea cuccullata TaxID=36930 RepID=UPI002ED44269
MRIPMRAKPKNVLFLILCVCIIPVFWISLVTKQNVPFPRTDPSGLEDIQDRLQLAEHVNKRREADLKTLRSNFLQILKGVIHATNQTNKSIAGMFQSDLALQLSNMSNISSENSLQLPSLFTYLPHIIGKPQSLRPSFQLSQNRFGVSIVIGIPTIRRDKSSYLQQTVKSLVQGMSAEERKECLIIVFVAEPNDPQYVKDVAESLKKQFPEELQSGLLEVIAPPAEFYPDFNNIKQTYGDTKERVRWRTKQNLDFSFLMMYARSKAIYYVQLEDDVISKPGYFTIMKTFAEQQSSTTWILLEFSTLGFIGKMFKSKDLPVVVEFFLMFYQDKPIDWLLDYFLAVKVCNPEKDHKHCSRMKGEMRRRYKPSLFQHVGTHSSLKGKVQKLKEKDFGKLMLHRAHANPRAELSTNLKAYQKFTLRKAYIGEDVFWAPTPAKGDFIQIKLQPPVNVEEILFRTGNPDHKADILLNGSVLIKPEESTTPSDVLLQAGFTVTGTGFYMVATFTDGLAQIKFSEDIGKIQYIKVLVEANNENWMIVSEIHIKERKSVPSQR